jgi:hypothetical protein
MVDLKNIESPVISLENVVLVCIKHSCHLYMCPSFHRSENYSLYINIEKYMIWKYQMAEKSLILYFWQCEILLRDRYCIRSKDRDPIMYSLQHWESSGLELWCCNPSFNNISVISWLLVLLVEETRENHQPVPSHWQTILYKHWKVHDLEISDGSEITDLVLLAMWDSIKGPSRSWSYGNCINDYLCNQCL